MFTNLICKNCITNLKIKSSFPIQFLSTSQNFNHFKNNNNLIFKNSNKIHRLILTHFHGPQFQPFSTLSSDSLVINKNKNVVGDNLKKGGWVPIYRFKHIVVARRIQKLKILQTGFTCLIVLPLIVGSYFYGLVTENVLETTISLSFLACAMLYMMGRSADRIIGMMYISENEPEVLRIAKLTFTGNREDITITKNDFIPLSELEDNSSDIYVVLKSYNDENFKLYLSLKFGIILNREEFAKIFGDPDPNS